MTTPPRRHARPIRSRPGRLRASSHPVKPSRRCPLHDAILRLLPALTLALALAAATSAPARPAAAGSAAYETTRALLPQRFLRFDTKRFIVLSDADPRWTREQASRLERTYHQFLRFTRRLDLRTRPLDAPLVCVLFENRDDYQSFALEHDVVQDPWVAGYYAPASDRVVFYRGDANPSVVEARAQLDRMHEEIASLDQDAEHARRSGETDRALAISRHLREYELHEQSERDRVAAFADRISIATTVHEAIHQLLFHTGVQSARVQYPLWISEGLATSFETDDTGGVFGPDREYAPRRTEFEKLLRANGLHPLRSLVTWADPPPGDAAVHALYHESYALVTWMARFRRDELRAYLDLMRSEQPGPITPQRYLAVFEQAFGDVDQLERTWLRYEKERPGG